MSDLLREALIGADPLDPRPSWQSAPSSSLTDTRAHAERTGGTVERRVKAGPWERVD